MSEYWRKSPVEADGRIADALQAGAVGPVEGALLLGYGVVAEWLNLDGVRFLSVESGSGDGGDVPVWQLRGYLNEALNHWGTVVVDEDEDDE